MVGISDKLLPLTGRAWRGSETEARPPHQITIGLWNRNVPAWAAGITVWLAGEEAIHPKGGNVRRFGHALIAMFYRGLGLS